MTTPFTHILDGLIRHRGVFASLVVDPNDGIIIDSNLQMGEDGTRVAALAASLYRKARRSAAASGFGETGFMHMEAEGGRICLLGGDDIVLVVVADPHANVGIIRMEMLRAAAAFA